MTYYGFEPEDLMRMALAIDHTYMLVTQASRDDVISEMRTFAFEETNDRESGILETLAVMDDERYNRLMEFLEAYSSVYELHRERMVSLFMKGKFP